MKVLKQIAGFVTTGVLRPSEKTDLPFSVFDWTINQMAESIEPAGSEISNRVNNKATLDRQLVSSRLMAKYWDVLAREAQLAGDCGRHHQALTCRHFYCKLIQDLLHLRGIKWPETIKTQN